MRTLDGNVGQVACMKMVQIPCLFTDFLSRAASSNCYDVDPKNKAETREKISQMTFLFGTLIC